MAELTEIRWHGRGGQGVVTAGKLLAETAMGSGQYFQAFPDYGPERMGAPIRAFTRLSSKPITIHSQIEEPNIVLVLDPTLLGTVPVAEGLKQDGALLVNTSMSQAEVRKAEQRAERRRHKAAKAEQRRLEAAKPRRARKPGGKR